MQIATDNGKSNQNIPNQVWLYIFRSPIFINDSKSGVILPAIKPVAENIFLRVFKSGNTIAG